MKIYLCGGISGLSDGEAVDWRSAAAHLLAGLGHTTLDPMRRDYRGREDESVTEIVTLDLNDILDSDGVLVNAARPSWGTAMEVFFAFSSARKPVVIVHPEGAVSPWLRFHSDAICRTFPEAIARLTGVTA